MAKSLITELAGPFADWWEIDTKKACEQSLIELVSYLWDIADPGEPLIHGWAMDAIADHLEMTYYGHIKRLLITVPPGFSKSSLTNVFFPLWVWLQQPTARFIKASYEQGIPERDNLKCERIIGHEKWQRFWGERFKLVHPSSVPGFENDKTGWQMATGVGAKLIGYRGNYICVDDPNDPSVENQSGIKRVKAVRWFRETVPTRLNNMERDVIILIQQRLHMEDCAGTALSLAHENYVHLNIPMEYEKRVYINAWVAEEPESEVMQDTVSDSSGGISSRQEQWDVSSQHNARPSPPEEGANDIIATLFDDQAKAIIKDHPDAIFWQDPRTDEGELAWPERFPPKVVDRLKKTLGRTMVSAQLQQRPVPRGGNIIREDAWVVWDKDTFPPFSFLLATLDTAYTEKTANDPSGLCIWGLFRDAPIQIAPIGGSRPVLVEPGNPKIMLVYAWTDWMELNPLVRKVMYTCTKPKNTDSAAYPEFAGLPRFPIDRLVIEGKASGLSVQQEIVRLVSLGYGRTLAVDMLPPKLLRDDKIARLVSVSHLFENGMIYAPNKEYADQVIDQVGNFPYATHDEYVDCTSMALRWFRDQGFAPTREEVFEDEERVKAYQPRLPPLYGGLG